MRVRGDGNEGSWERGTCDCGKGATLQPSLATARLCTKDIPVTHFLGLAGVTNKEFGPTSYDPLEGGTTCESASKFATSCKTFVAAF